MVAGAPAEPARPVRLAVHVVLGVRRLERPAGRAGCLRHAGGGPGLPAPAGLLGPRLGALCRRRRARRPGPVRARVAGTAPVCDRARHPADRRHPDLRRTGQRRDRVPRRAFFERSGRRGSSRRLAPRGAALGAAGVRLEGDAPGGLPVVDRALPPDPGAGGRRAGRPLPRLRRVLGRASRREEPARGQLASRPRSGALRGDRARARPAAADRRGPGDHHAGGRPAAQQSRPARDADRRSRLRQASPGTGTRSPRTSRTRSSTPAPTTIRRWRAGSRPPLRRISPSPSTTLRRRASRTTTPSGRSSGSRSRRGRAWRSCRCRTSSASAPRRR